MSRALDQIDHAILGVLRTNARLTNKELAAHIGLAPSSCLERVRRLHTEGVLIGYHALIRPDALGVGLQALLGVQLHQPSSAALDAFREQVARLPEVMDVFHTAGVADFVVRVGVRDARHLRELVGTAFSARDDVARVTTALIYEHTRAEGLC